MDENTRASDAANERSLDPNESWGQGTDASHTESAADASLPNDLGTDPSLAGNPTEDEAADADGPPLT